MPEDPERVVGVRQLDRLRRAVVHGGDPQPLADPVDPLVVVGLDGDVVSPRRAGGERARFEPHVVVAVGAGGVHVVAVAEFGG